MENAHTDTIASLSAEAIVAKMHTLNAREQELVRLAQAAYASGGPAVPPAPQLKHVDRARQILNGMGGLLPPPNPLGESDSDIQAELSATRLALHVLNKARQDRDELDNAEWAGEHAAEWLGKVRKLTLAMAIAFEALTDCGAFMEDAGPGRTSELPSQQQYWATLLTFRGSDWANPTQILKDAVDDGLIKQSEIKGVFAHVR